MTRPTVLLFDIDGTLIRSGGVGRRSLELAFDRHYGRATMVDGILFDGMTDRAIVRTALREAGEPCAGSAAETAIDALLASYVEFLHDEAARSQLLSLHPGVVQVLDAAAEWSHAALGLGTGNIRPGAAVKLGRVGIFDRFMFGGFGCDHEDRATLLRIGAARGTTVLGVPSETCRIVVIGDTPRDVQAALAIGAEMIGVGTSRFSANDLRACGAHAAFDDLTHPAALEVRRRGL